MSTHAFVTDEKIYKESYSAFYCEGSTYTELGMQWWKKELPDITRRCKDAYPTEPFRVLSVGTGNGKPYDEYLLDYLLSTGITVDYTVVEPRLEAIQEFTDLVQRKYDNMADIHTFQTTYQVYLDNNCFQDSPKFHMILFIHSLYFIGPTWEILREKIRQCYNEMLVHGGVMVTYLGNSSGKTFFHYNTSLSMASFGELYLSPNVIGRLADQEGWANEVYGQNARADVTLCFDASSYTGNRMLDFIMQESHFRDSNDKETVDKVLKSLEENCEVMEDGRKVIEPIKYDISVIWKVMEKTLPKKK